MALTLGAAKWLRTNSHVFRRLTLVQAVKNTSKSSHCRPLSTTENSKLTNDAWQTIEENNLAQDGQTQSIESLTSQVKYNMTMDAVVKRVEEREQFYEKLLEETSTSRFADKLKNGVHADSNDPQKWAFTMTDSCGRVESRDGFLTRKAAEEAYEIAQEAYLTPELTALMREQLKARYDADTALTQVIEDMDAFSNSRREKLESVWQMEDSDETSSLISRATVFKMTPEQITNINQSSVLRARHLWQASDDGTVALAEVVAARIRQNCTEKEIRRLHDLIWRYQSQANGKSKQLLNLLKEFRNYPGIYPHLLKVLALDKYPVLSSADTKERWESVFYGSSTTKKSDISIRINEMFPDEQARLDPKNVETFQINNEEKAKAELAMLLNLQHDLSIVWHESSPPEVTSLLDQIGILDRPARYGGNEVSEQVMGKIVQEGNITQNDPYTAWDWELLQTLAKGHKIISEQLPLAFKSDHQGSTLVELRHAMKDRNLETLLSQYFVDEFAPAIAIYSHQRKTIEDTSIQALTHRATQQFWKKYLSESDKAQAQRTIAIDRALGMERDTLEILSLATESAEDSEEFGWLEALHKIPSDADRTSITVGAARPEAIERAGLFIEKLRENVPFASRAAFAQILRIERPYKYNMTPTLPLWFPNILSLLEPMSRELIGSMNDFIALDAFRFHATIAILRNELEIAHASLLPNLIPDLSAVASSKALPFELPSLYDMEAGNYEHSLRSTRNELMYVRPGDERYQSSDTRLIHGIPEARLKTKLTKLTVFEDSEVHLGGSTPKTKKSKFKGTFDWCGMDGRWYGSIQDAIRTWYTPDIVGSWKSHSQQVDALVALRNVTDASMYNPNALVHLQQVVRPESVKSTMQTALQIADQCDSRTKAMICSSLMSFWEQTMPMFYDNGRVAAKAGEHLNYNHLEHDIFSSLKHTHLRMLVPRVFQNLTSLTPERIAAVDYVLRANRDENQDTDDVFGSSELTLLAEPGNNSMDEMGTSTSNVPGAQIKPPTNAKPLDIFPWASRYLFDDLENIGQTEGVLADPDLASFRSDEDWVGRTIYLADIPTQINEKHIVSVLEEAFGPVEAISLHKERTSAYTKTSELLKGEFEKLSKKRSSSVPVGGIGGKVPLDPSHLDQETSGKRKKVRDVQFSDEEMLGTADDRAELLQRFTRRKAQFEDASVELVRNAYDAILWYNDNWSLAEVVWAADHDLHMNKMERRSLLKDLKVDNADFLERLLKQRSLNGDKLSEKLFQSADDLREANLLLDELLRRLKDASFAMERAWDRYRLYSYVNFKIYRPFPETSQELNLQGAEFLDPLEAEKVPKSMETLESMYYNFKNAMKYMIMLMRITPGLFSAQTEASEKLCRQTAEVMRRRRVVELALQQDSNVDPLASKGSTDGVKDHGFLGDTTRKDFTADGDIPAELREALSTDSLYDEEVDDIDHEGSDVTEVSDEFETNEKSTGTTLAEEATTPEGWAENDATVVAQKFADLYKSMAGDSYAERIANAKSLRSLLRKTQEGTKSRSATAQQLVNVLAPKSGFYAFVTFRNSEAYEAAMHPAVSAFGLTLTLPKNADSKLLSDMDLFDFDLKSGCENFVLGVSPANTRRGLFIEGFRDGITAGEVSFILQDILRPLFPQLSLRVRDRNRILTTGGSYIHFTTHAESRAAYMALKDKIVEGQKLNIGWSERSRQKRNAGQSSKGSRAKKPSSKDPFTRVKF